ncbi:hypothetical protein RHGRI_000549 [Rhododendron griersonianum]|uniref:Uncharacterized protein n=1 Tax=Rhododendron griersonianum TaxID=479676 RepID=A0AAV6LI61_9ERIC|nr:hypothetical protein RHGRI_000549 [Rhododendron griersonianum]
MEMEQILTIFAAIDLSSNKFEGEIPEIIGGLNSIRGLNLSHNHLTDTVEGGMNLSSVSDKRLFGISSYEEKLWLKEVDLMGDGNKYSMAK